LKQVSDAKTHEANHQAEKLKHLNAEIARMSTRVDEITILIENKNNDLRNL
jgi:hypothetical protein